MDFITNALRGQTQRIKSPISENIKFYLKIISALIIMICINNKSIFYGQKQVS